MRRVTGATGRLWVWSSLLLSLAFGRVGAQQRTDVVHGRVTGSDTAGISGATVAVLVAPGTPPKITRTDARGAYSITIENGGGAYTVAVNMLGYAPQRRQIAREGDKPIPAVDFKLVPVAANLSAVRSTGQRPKATRSDARGEFTPGASVSYLGLSGGLSGDVTGDLTAALSTLPGITVTPNATGLPTISAFGVDGGQNNTVLNGLGFGSQPPRDGFFVSVVQSTYDPGRGGFAGVQLALRMSPGSNFITQSVHGTLDAPSLQWTTPVASHLGNQYDQQVVSGVLSGPIVPDKAFYAFSYQVNHRASDLPTLVTDDPGALLALHVSPDSVARLLAALGPDGIPLRTSGSSTNRFTTEGRFAARLDYAPTPPQLPPGFVLFNSLNPTSDAYNIQFGGDWRSQGGAGIGPTSLPATGAGQTHRDGWLQATAAKYIPWDVLSETNVSVNASDDLNQPNLLAPSARILVNSTLDDGSIGVSSVQVGGSGAARTDTRAWSTELRQELSRYTWDRHHETTITLDGTLDHYSIDQSSGLGAFSFNSLEDFINDAPASFSRSLTGSVRAGEGETGAIGLGDIYGPNDRFRAQYGLRLEGNRLGVHPAYNQLVESTFGLRTDHVPSTVSLAPMAGFSWSTPWSIEHGPSFGPRGVSRFQLSGGVREYRGTISTRMIDGYARQTGLADAIQQLFCVGAAAPTPDWRTYVAGAGVPSACADGSTGTVLAQQAPPVALFAPDYQLLESWRPTLSLLSRFPNTVVTLGGTMTYNRHVPGIYDVNFAGAPRFTLSDEANRPVYVSAGSIVPGTGTASYTESRVSTAFSHVAESRSDLSATARTLIATVSLAPRIAFATQVFWNGSLSYAYTDAREQFYGFSGAGSTAGDPRERLEGSSSTPRHVVTLTGNVRFPTLGYIQLSARAQSASLYSPMVAGDVNGDGYSNDRAFVFDPAHTSDPAVASAMQSLLSNAPSYARDCLRRQLGEIAGRNSCTGPWSMPMLNLTLAPDSYLLHLGNRANVSMYVNNILSGADQLVHGAGHLHGWGQYAYTDPTLLTVRGFDHATNRFTYTVNPLFGNTSVFRSTFRAPFTVSLDVRLEVGPDRESQYIENNMRPGKGEKPDSLSLQQIKNKIAPRPFNPLDAILQRKDSLNLTEAQVDSMTKLSKVFAVYRDSVITDLARYLVSRRGNYDGDEVRGRWHRAGIANYIAARNLAASVRGLFTPAQMEKLRADLSLGTFITTDYTPEEIKRLLRGPIMTLP